MQDIERLDYSKPPPGFRRYGRVGPDADYYIHYGDSRISRLSQAWAHYKKRHDPPALFERANDFSAWGNAAFLDVDTSGAVPPLRAAAWFWYDRRLALARRVADAVLVASETFRGRPLRTVIPASDARYFDESNCELAPLDVWPRCLTWSDDQVAAVERWLVDSTSERPEVLRA